MAERTVDELRARRQALDARLDQPEAAARAGGAQGEIGALFKIGGAGDRRADGVREDVLELVEKWKRRQGATRPSVAPQFAAAKPAVHADHIGASTFIEKGWSKISAGDHAGAEADLTKALAAVARTIRRRSRCWAGR